MKNSVTVICAVLALAGCATSEPLTPEQAQVLINMQQQQQANNAAAMNNMQNNTVFQRMPQPTYTAPARPINCQTVRVYNTFQTRCY